jgi:hypothetical protein
LSYEGFQIRANQAFNSTYPCTIHKTLNAVILPSPPDPESFNSHVQAQLVAILETVGDCLFRIVDTNWYAINLIAPDPLGEGPACEPVYAQRGMF